MKICQGLAISTSKIKDQFPKWQQKIKGLIQAGEKVSSIYIFFIIFAFISDLQILQYFTFKFLWQAQIDFNVFIKILLHF